MAYLISEEAQDLLQDVKNFCDKEVAEQCKEYDVSGEWPKAIYDKAVEQGYQALEVPEEFGGPGLSRVDVAALIEQMAIADAGFATTISASGLGMKPVLIAGSDRAEAACLRSDPRRRLWGILSDRAGCRLRCQRRQDHSGERRR